MAEWCEGTIIENKRWTDALFSLVIKAPIAAFTAGQFAKLALEINGQRVQRAYSYVNAPTDPHLEFYLVNVPDGQLSPSLHGLKAGDRVQVTTEAAGFFVLNEVPTCQTLWMLATGTAIGPYLSILQQQQDLHRFQHIVLVHAVRYANDLSYLPLMQALQQQLKGKLTIQTVVSREEAVGSLLGRVPKLIESGQLEQSVGYTIDPESSHVMLCGNPDMVRETRQLLKDTRQMRNHLRRKPGHITCEQYW